MNAGTVTPECTELLSRITKRNLRQEELTPPVVFLAAFVVVGMGVVYADNRAKEEEQQLLQEMLNQLAPPGSEMRPWVQQLTHGTQAQQVYKNSHDLQTLTNPLSESEKLLLLGLGYKLSKAEVKLDAYKIKYLRTVANKININSENLAILEAGINLGTVKNETILNRVYSLLDPVNFVSIKSLLNGVGGKVPIALPPRLSGNGDRKPSGYSPELELAATRLQDKLKTCFDELSKLDLILKTKPGIINIDAQEIWTHIGDFTGYRIKLANLGNLVENRGVRDRIDRDWQTWIEDLQKRIQENWLGDHELDNINVDDKKELTQLLTKQFNQTLNAEIEKIAGDNASQCLSEVFSALDGIERNILAIAANSKNSNFGDSILSEIKLSRNMEFIMAEGITQQEWAEIEALELWIDDLATGIFKFRASAVSKIGQKMAEKGWASPEQSTNTKSAIAEIKQKILEKGWKKFEQSKNQFPEQLKMLVVSIVNQKIEAAIAITENAIALYEQLLEDRERYRQEKPEQRQKETAWVARQQQHLEQVQQNIDAILESSSDDFRY